MADSKLKAKITIESNVDEQIEKVKELINLLEKANDLIELLKPISSIKNATYHTKN